MAKKITVIVLICLVCVGSFFCGHYVTTAQYDRQLASQDKVLLSTEEYNKLASFSKLNSVLELVDEYYYADYEMQTAVDMATKGMLYALKDNYAYYYTPEETEELYTQEEGNYVGIGVQIILDDDGYVTVTNTFPGSPALEGGVLVGDRIYAVNGEYVVGLDATEISELVRGEAGTDVDVTFLRGEETVDLKLTRAEVVETMVSYKMIGDIGFIRLEAFSGDVVEKFKEAVSFIESSNAKGLVLDLRYNGGGYLLDLDEIADILLPEGTMYYTEGQHSPKMVVSSDSRHLGLPMAVLVNGYTISASEILSGALQDYGTPLIGTTTYGKGVVQTQFPFKDGSMVKFTTAYYYTPNGRCIHGEGLAPDYEVSDENIELYSLYTADPEHDPQLAKAIEVVTQSIEK